MGRAETSARKSVFDRRGRVTIALFRLGSRGSKLALIQAHIVKAQLESTDPLARIEVVSIKTSGDKGDRDQLGAFVHEIQLATQRGEVDFGLHCLKDLPTEEPNGLLLASYLEREDPRDALIGPSGGLGSLAAGAVVGTGSVRRSAQLAHLRPDLLFKPLIGNVDTRLRKLAEGEYDAMILAMAGIIRMGLLKEWPLEGYEVTPLGANVMLPAPGQGILVLECRAGDETVEELSRKIEHADTKGAAQAERSFLRGFGGGCSVPVAALGITNGGEVTLAGLVSEPDGRRQIRGNRQGRVEYADLVGKDLADEVGGRGGFRIIRNIRPLAGMRVMITRPESQAESLRRELSSLGAEVYSVPVVCIVPPTDSSSLSEALKNLDSYDWLVLTSVNGVEAVATKLRVLGASLPDNLKIAAIGPATAASIEKEFRAPDLVPEEFVAEAIAASLPDVRDLRFLLARADIARRDLADALRQKGAEVDEVIAYRIERLDRADFPEEAPDAITLTSAEIARATSDLLKASGRGDWLDRADLVCIGPVTAEAVRQLGYEPATIASSYDTAGLLKALIDLNLREGAYV